MLIFVLIIDFLIICLAVLSRKEELSEDISSSLFTKLFYKIAKCIYRKLFIQREIQSQYVRKIYDCFRILRPGSHTSLEIENFFIKKIGYCIMILFFGLIVIGISDKQSDKNNILLDDGLSIERDDYDGSEKEIILDAYVDDEYMQDISVLVENKKYSLTQLNELLPDFETELQQMLIGENESPDFVNRPIVFVKEISGYPFDVQYIWDDKQIITRDGDIGENVPSEGILQEIQAIISYEDFKETYYIYLNVFPMDLTYQESIKRKINNLLILEDNYTDDYYVLPSSIDGMTIRWTEQKKKNTFLFVVLMFLTIIFIYIGHDRDLYEQLNKRAEQMIDDYPEIVSKLTLLISAGMSLRSAWKKMAIEYRDKRDNGDLQRRYAYEEMLYTVYEMESGVEESLCFQNFSMRCKVQKYIKLAALLDQSLKLGAKGFIDELKKESRDALEDKKKLAEKKGEQAGTKLLLPMMLMMLVVMIVIMVPAFMGI